MNKTIVIDASGGILGRIASNAAKKALLCNKIIILNCNEALLMGGRRMIIEEYKIARVRGGSSLNGPNFPREPFRVMKRAVRGMLPYKQQRGRVALENVICHNKTPKEFENSEKISFKKEARGPTFSLLDLSKEI